MWTRAARLRAQLPRAADRGGAHRYRVVGIPSGVVAGRAHGIGWAAWPRTVGVPGRRQSGLGDRTAARGVHRVATWADERRVVLSRGADRDGRAVSGGALVQGARHRAPQAEEAL